MFTLYDRYARHIVHTLVGGGGQHGGFDALHYCKIRTHIQSSHCCLTNLQGSSLGFMIERLDLPHLSADRSDFDVHGVLLDD